MTGSGWGRCGLTISVHHHYTGYALILMLWFASALSVTSYEASGVDQDEGIDIPLAGASVHQILSQLRNTPEFSHMDEEELRQVAEQMLNELTQQGGGYEEHFTGGYGEGSIPEGFDPTTYTLERFEISNTVVDLTKPDSHESVTISLTLQAKKPVLDLASGVTAIPSQVLFLSPQGQSFAAFFYPLQHQVSGDEANPSFETTLEFSYWTATPGFYQLEYVIVFDEDEQQYAFERNVVTSVFGVAGFEVKGGGAGKDSDAPLLVDLAIEQEVGCTLPLAARNRYELGATVGCPLVIWLDIIERESGLANRATDFTFTSHITLQSKATLGAAHQLIELPIIEAHQLESFSGQWEAREGQPTTPLQVPPSMGHHADAQLYRVVWDVAPHIQPGEFFVKELLLVDKAGHQTYIDQQTLEQGPFSSTVHLDKANVTFLGTDMFDFIDAKAFYRDPYNVGLVLEDEMFALEQEALAEELHSSLGSIVEQLMTDDMDANSKDDTSNGVESETNSDLDISSMYDNSDDDDDVDDDDDENYVYEDDDDL
eukprot:m.44420 g.44420  ORF g.44420 m.44420 type:complete len:541 (-) comp10830_c0_seq3:370-1992(-)